MLKMSKFYDLLRGHANIKLTDATGSTVFYEGTLNATPDAFDNCTVIDFDAESDLAGEVTYCFQIKR